MYVNQPALPGKVQVGSWQVGGVNRSEALLGLDERLKKLGTGLLRWRWMSPP